MITMKKTLSYSDQVKLEKIFLGIIWFIVGVLSFADGIPSLIIQAIAAITCILTLLGVSTAKKENADEMAEQNMNRAKALASDYMLIIYCCIAIFSILFLNNVEFSISLSQIIPGITFMILGTHHLIVGLAFRKFEEE